MPKIHKINLQLSRYEEFLCLAVRHIEKIDPQQLYKKYKQLDDTKLFQIAQKNGVASNVAHAISTHFPKQCKVAKHWVVSYENMDVRISNYMNELDKLAEVFSKNGFKLVALKNAGIARSIYKYNGASPMGDLDLLILPENFFEAHKLLEEMGYIFSFRNIYESEDLEKAFKNGGSEYYKILRSGEKLWVELQWRPIAGRWIRPEQEPKSSVLFLKAKKIYGSEALILSAEDNLLQVCLHTAKHSYVRAPGFRLHTDVDRIVSSINIDWNIFSTKVKNLNVRTAVYISLVLSHNLLSTQIPEKVLNDLKPSRLKTKILLFWLKKVGLFNPNGKKWSNIGYIVFVALLYDRISHLIKAVFPPLAEIREKNKNAKLIDLPFIYIKRLASLVFKRVGI